jgi:hypothetical protein
MTEFHAKSFRLLPKVPGILEAALAKIAEDERRIERPLPPSVRDWYARENACAIPRTYSNDDPPVELDDLGRPLRACSNDHGARNLAADGLLHIRTEKQGDCFWTVQLDDEDDPPPVVVTFDRNSLQDWQRHADRFSDYVFACVWDYGSVMVSERLIQAQNVPVTAQMLEQLCRSFREEVRTYGWPGCTQHRFERDDQRLLLWASSGQAGWWRSANSAASATIAVWSLDGVGQASWSNTEEGEEILHQARSHLAD